MSNLNVSSAAANSDSRPLSQYVVKIPKPPKMGAPMKIAIYFANFGRSPKGCPQMSLKSLSGFIRTDRNESGVNSGDGSLTAETWNGIMKNLGISGFRIKNSISIEEYKAFLEKYKIF